MAAQRLVRRLPVGESRGRGDPRAGALGAPGPGAAARPASSIAWGPGPRASQALMLAVRARALLDGRFAPSVDDVVALAEPVLKHRMALTFAARADGETIAGVIGRAQGADRMTRMARALSVHRGDDGRPHGGRRRRRRSRPPCRG